MVCNLLDIYGFQDIIGRYEVVTTMWLVRNNFFETSELQNTRFYLILLVIYSETLFTTYFVTSFNPYLIPTTNGHRLHNNHFQK